MAEPNSEVAILVKKSLLASLSRRTSEVTILEIEKFSAFEDKAGNVGYRVKKYTWFIK